MLLTARQGQGRHREVRSEGSRRQNRDLRNTSKFVAVRSDEWAQDHEVRTIKGQSGKLCWCAGKINILIWGDLRSGHLKGQP